MRGRGQCEGGGVEDPELAGVSGGRMSNPGERMPGDKER